MTVTIGRRELLPALGGAAAAWPLPARARQAGKMWRIGLIAHEQLKHYDVLFDELRQLGYVEGHNIIVDRRYAQGSAERFDEFAAEMVRLKADLIIVNTTPAAIAVKKVTTTTPIVIPTAIDPVGAGLISSFAHPGGNITGSTILSAELSAKRLELLKEVIPGLSRMAVLWNDANPANTLAWTQTQDAARAIGVTLQPHAVQGPMGLELAFAKMAAERSDAVFVLEDALIIQYLKQIIDFANEKRLPTVFGHRDRVEAGGLMSYGPRFAELMRRAASQVDKILKGARPADLPVELPTAFEFVINLKTAKALRLLIPDKLLALADEVIE